MATKLSKEQMQLAQQLHNTGVTWSVVATYFKLTESQLSRQRKHYEHINTT